MRRKESAIISSSLQSLLLWSGKQHPGHTVRHQDFVLLLQRLGEWEGLSKEGNEATFLLWHCRFLSSQTAGDVHRSLLQTVTSILLHTCSNCMRFYVSNDSPSFHIPCVGLLCVEISSRAEGCNRVNRIIYFELKELWNTFTKWYLILLQVWAWTHVPATYSLECLHKDTREEKAGTHPTFTWMLVATSKDLQLVSFFPGCLFRSYMKLPVKPELLFKWQAVLCKGFPSDGLFASLAKCMVAP